MSEVVNLNDYISLDDLIERWQGFSDLVIGRIKEARGKKDV